MLSVCSIEEDFKTSNFKLSFPSPPLSYLLPIIAMGELKVETGTSYIFGSEEHLFFVHSNSQSNSPYFLFSPFSLLC